MADLRSSNGSRRVGAAGRAGLSVLAGLALLFLTTPRAAATLPPSAALATTATEQPTAGCLSGLTAAAPTDGTGPAGSAQNAPAPPAPGWLPASASLVPGLLLHGSGHWVAGDRPTALRLLAAEGVGLATLVAGFAPIVASGASSQFIGTAYSLTLGGLGLFFVTAAADLYGAAGAAHPARPRPPLPPLELALGGGYVQDPQFAFAPFAVLGGSVRLAALRLSPLLWQATDGQTARLRLDAGWRVLGPGPGDGGAGASWLELQAAATRHGFPDEGFVTWTGEVALAGRYDAAAFAPSLAGSFAEATLGWGMQRFVYDVPDADADVDELLLMRFGYGVAFGAPGRVQSELTAFYDHRRDDFAGAGAGGSGIPGHVGLAARLDWPGGWGLQGEGLLGGARVASLLLVRRFGADR